MTLSGLPVVEVVLGKTIFTVPTQTVCPLTVTSGEWLEPFMVNIQREGCAWSGYCGDK